MYETRIRQIEEKLDHLLHHAHVVQIQQEVIINLITGSNNAALDNARKKLKAHTDALKTSIASVEKP